MKGGIDKMNLKENELRVFYGGKLNERLDKALKECIAKFGYTRWASGYDLVDNIRDLAFDKEG